MIKYDYRVYVSSHQFFQYSVTMCLSFLLSHQKQADNIGDSVDKVFAIRNDSFYLGGAKNQNVFIL